MRFLFVSIVTCGLPACADDAPDATHPGSEPSTTDSGTPPDPTTPPSGPVTFSGSVSDVGGEPLDATLFLFQGVERRADTDPDGWFSLGQVEPVPSALHLFSTTPGFAFVEGPLVPTDTALELILPPMPSGPLPERAALLELAPGLQLRVGSDTLSVLFGDGTVGAAELLPGTLGAFAALPGEEVAAWAVSPHSGAAEPPLDLVLSLGVPDGSYRLLRSGDDVWVELGQAEASGGVLDFPASVDRLGVLVLVRDPT